MSRRRRPRRGAARKALKLPSFSRGQWDAFGRIDVLVNNAGYRIRARLGDLPRHEWDAMVDTNLTGVFLLCQAVGRVMIQQRRGTIVNVTSVAGRTGSRGLAAYAATKAGVTVLTQSLGAEWRSTASR
jgi:NAD(P)-dependent dehydrogenase (short-subunit alcohol dehydrogenase family)